MFGILVVDTYGFNPTLGLILTKVSLPLRYLMRGRFNPTLGLILTKYLVSIKQYL